MTTVADSSITHTMKEKETEKRERERDARQNDSEVQKIARLEVRII